MIRSDISELETGKAGEYLVCADMILAGYTAFPSEQGLPFDIVSEVGGRLIKVQVKTTKAVRTLKDPNRAIQRSGYLFQIKRMGHGGKKTYAPGAVDMFALVALDSREIGYILPKEIKQTMIFRASSLRGTYANEVLDRRMGDIKTQIALGKPVLDIAKDFQLDKTYVYKIKNKPPETCGRSGIYLSDLTLNKALAKMVLL